MPEETNVIAAKPNDGGLGIPESVVVDIAAEAAAQPSAPTQQVLDTSGKTPTSKELLEKVINPEEAGIPEADFADFLAAKEGAVNNAPKTEVKVEVKPEVKVESAKKPEVVAKVEPVKVEEKNKNQTGRDYTGFNPEEIEAFKRMSNDAFAYVRPRILENKKLSEVISAKDKEIANLKVGKQELPASYYEHPEGYMFSPEYEEVAKQADVFSNVKQHWQQQLIRIHKGEKWTPLKGMDKNGNLIPDAPREGTIEDQVNVQSFLQNSNNKLMEMQGQKGRIQAEFKARHNQASEIVRGAIKQNFAAYEQPNHPMRPVLDSIRANLPKEFSGTPIYDLAVNSSAAAIQFGNLYREALGKITELEGKLKGAPKVEVKDVARSAGPTDGDASQSGVAKPGSSQEVEVTFDDFEKAKNQ